MGSRIGFWAPLLLICGARGLVHVFHTSLEIGAGPGHAPMRVFALWDDARISMSYARNLAHGEGLVWNPGESPVRGFTNLGVTLSMALLHLLLVSPARVSLGLAYRLARVLLPGDEWAARLATLGVAFHAPLSVWTLRLRDLPSRRRSA